jgi:N-carbamoylputrescine amidase
MKLSLIQMNAGDNRDANVEKACTLIDEAARGDPELIVLPEFFNYFYFAMYRDYKYIQMAEREDGYTMSRVMEKARQHNVHIIATIYEEQIPGIYYDTAMLVNPEGQITGKYRKTHPPGNRSLERIYYRHGSKFPVFQVADWKVGIIICFDLLFPEAARCAMLNGAELLVVPFCEAVNYLSPAASSLPENTGEKAMNREAWLRQWDLKTAQRAIENQVYLAACNHVGQEKDAVILGQSRVVDPWGKVIVSAGEKEGIVHCELDRSKLLGLRQTTSILRDRQPELYSAITTNTEDLPLK